MYFGLFLSIKMFGITGKYKHKKESSQFFLRGDIHVFFYIAFLLLLVYSDIC